MLTFLEANGFTIDADPMDIAVRLEAVANRTETLEEATNDFANWLREQT
jgi:prophage maintenance system killer protein